MYESNTWLDGSFVDNALAHLYRVDLIVCTSAHRPTPAPSHCCYNTWPWRSKLQFNNHRTRRQLRIWWTGPPSPRPYHTTAALTRPRTHAFTKEDLSKMSKHASHEAYSRPELVHPWINLVSSDATEAPGGYRPSLRPIDTQIESWRGEEGAWGGALQPICPGRVANWGEVSEGGTQNGKRG